MKTLILYGSPTKLTKAHKLVSGRNQPRYYVRMRTSKHDLTQALTDARPQIGETVLNTVPDA